MRSLLVLTVAVGGLTGCVAYVPADYDGGQRGYRYTEPRVYVQPGPAYVAPPRYPYYRNGPRRDRDRDGVPDRYDRDRDGDGVPNWRDPRP